MNSTVAITGIAGHTVIVLAAIHYGVKGLALLLPQLRVQAPPKAQADAAQAAIPAAAVVPITAARRAL